RRDVISNPRPSRTRVATISATSNTRPPTKKRSSSADMPLIWPRRLRGFTRISAQLSRNTTGVSTATSASSAGATNGLAGFDKAVVGMCHGCSRTDDLCFVAGVDHQLFRRGIGDLVSCALYELPRRGSEL